MMKEIGLMRKWLTEPEMRKVKMVIYHKTTKLVVDQYEMFYSQVSEALIESITKGTGIIFAEEVLGTNYIRYQHIPLVQMYLGDDGRGESIDEEV
ncbi:MAG: hypothetical protein ORN54_06890 [Cyclobacteriaceae bacterium]|nr:hypothetical protein [Cyclobacteriaceae bacterium]